MLRLRNLQSASRADAALATLARMVQVFARFARQYAHTEHTRATLEDGRISYNAANSAVSNRDTIFNWETMQDDSIITLEVAIDRQLLDELTEAAHHRGQSISEFVETILRREVEIACQEPVRELTEEPSDE